MGKNRLDWLQEFDMIHGPGWQCVVGSQQRKLHLLQAGVAQVPRFQRDSGGAGVTYSLRTTTTIFPLCSGRVLLFYFFAKTGRVLLTDYTHTAANVIAKNVLVRQDSGTLYTRIYMDELGQNLFYEEPACCP
jgi:hypothetical protein